MNRLQGNLLAPLLTFLQILIIILIKKISLIELDIHLNGHLLKSHHKLD